MQSLSYQKPSKAQNPLSFIKKQIQTRNFSENDLYAARSISSQFCILFYQHNALIIDVQTERVVQQIIYPIIEENKSVYGEKFLAIEGGFVIQVQNCHIYQKQKYTIIKPQKKVHKYSTKMYFPDTGIFCSPCIYRSYYSNFEQIVFCTQYDKVETLSARRQHKQANDQSLVLIKVDTDKKIWTFLDLMRKKQYTIPLLNIVLDEQWIESLSIVDQFKGLIILKQNKNLYVMYWFNIERQPHYSKQLLRFSNCKSMKLLRRRIDLVLIFVNYYDKQQQKEVSRNILYSLKAKKIVWQKDLVNNLLKGSIWNNYFSSGLDSFVEHVKDDKFSNTKVTCYQKIKKKNAYIDLLTKSGIRNSFGDVVVKETAKVLS